MNEDKLSTCHEEVRRGTIKLEEALKEQGSTALHFAHAFDYLDQFESELPEKYLDEFPPEDVEVWHAQHEESVQMTHTAKMAKRRGMLSSIPFLNNCRNKIAQSIEMSGRIAANVAPTVGPLWFLLQFDNISAEISETIDWISSEEFIESYSDSVHDPRQFAVAALCLAEYDYFSYSDEIDRLCRRIRDALLGTSADPLTIHDCLRAVIRSSIDTKGLVSETTDHFLNNPEEWLTKSESQEFDIYNAGYALPILCFDGKGIKEPINDPDWNDNFQSQKIEHIRPELLITKPSTRLGDRDISIYNKLETMIEAVFR